MRIRTALVILVCASSVVAGAPAGAANDGATIERRFLEILNAGRGQAGAAPLVVHVGLRGEGRAHSRDMSTAGTLTHDGFSGRVSGAAPDPAEANGAPDDGFDAACENVAYWYPGGAGASDDAVAQRFYDMWYASSGHKRCMFDEYGYGLNVAGIGVYEDAQGYFWATLLSVRDQTPPAAASATPTPGPTASPSPAPGSPTPTPSPPPATPTPTPTSGAPTPWTDVPHSSDVVSTVGAWSQDAGRIRSAQPGARVSLSFTGTAVRWVGTRWRYAGVTEVRIDGTAVATVDAYSPSVDADVVLFEVSGLAPGAHGLELVVTGDRNRRSRYSFTDVTRFAYAG